MPTRATKPPAYKDVTLGQLRSFCETARRGSLTAAAAALRLSHPTVWKQVHALEKTFGKPLIVPHVRGCRLTEAGEALLRLAAPNVFDLESLKRRLDEELQTIDIRINVVAPARLLSDDVAPCLPGYLTKYPQVRLTLSDVPNSEIEEMVESGRAEFGFATLSGRVSALLEAEPWYELDVSLVTPRNHPLAKRRTVRITDLSKYPLLNSRQTLADPAVHAKIDRAGLFDVGPRLVEARTAGTLRELVERGVGVALVIGKPGRHSAELHERVMSREFGRSRIHLVRRRGVHHHPAVMALAEEVRRTMTA
jgi:DNA-binding transcriptional LysR family regulator